MYMTSFYTYFHGTISTAFAYDNTICHKHLSAYTYTIFNV